MTVFQQIMIAALVAVAAVVIVLAVTGNLH
jgi:hypothetical protein